MALVCGYTRLVTPAALEPNPFLKVAISIAPGHFRYDLDLQAIEPLHPLWKLDSW